MKMRFSILFVLLALAFAGCSEGGLVHPGAGVPEDDLEISFSSVMTASAVTKVQSMTMDILKDTSVGFGVSAVHTPGVWADAADRFPEFFYDKRVVWDGGKWSYDPVKYWPTLKPERVSFFAYAPYGCGAIALCDTSSAAADPSSFHFTLAENSNETVDFVAASAIDKFGNPSTSDVVFVFRHELTRMEMFAKVDEDLYKDDDAANRTRVVVKSAKVSGSRCYTEAEYRHNTDPEDAPGTWDFSGLSTADYPLLICGGPVYIDASVPYEVEHGIVLTQKNIEYQLLVESCAVPQERYVFLIPPRGGFGLSEGDIAIEFEYDIVTEDDKLASGHICTSATKVVNLPAGTLRQGASYKYVFTFCVNQVKVDATLVYSDDGDIDVGV